MPEPTFTKSEELAFPKDIKEDIATFGRRLYSSSKLCNILCAYYLDRLLKEQKLSTEDSPIGVNAFDPGLMPGTGLARDYPGFMQFGWNVILPIFKGFMKNAHSSAESGTALAELMINPKYSQITAKYYNLLKEIPSSKESYDTERQLDLWNTSLRLINIQPSETILKL